MEEWRWEAFLRDSARRDAPPRAPEPCPIGALPEEHRQQNGRPHVVYGSPSSSPSRFGSKPTTASPSMMVTGVARKPRLSNSWSASGSLRMSLFTNEMPLRERNSFSCSQLPHPGCEYTITSFAILFLLAYLACQVPTRRPVALPGPLRATSPALYGIRPDRVNGARSRGGGWQRSPPYGSHKTARGLQGPRAVGVQPNDGPRLTRSPRTGSASRRRTATRKPPTPGKR